MKTVSEYWKRINDKKGEKLPENAFDFISIHNHADGFRLISPLAIIYGYSPNGDRPQFEYDIFPSLKIAKRAAEFIAALAEKEIGKKINVVFCN